MGASKSGAKASNDAVNVICGRMEPREYPLVAQDSPACFVDSSFVIVYFFLAQQAASVVAKHWGLPT
jgi:hypothetical protein